MKKIISLILIGLMLMTAACGKAQTPAAEEQTGAAQEAQAGEETGGAAAGSEENTAGTDAAAGSEAETGAESAESASAAEETESVRIEPLPETLSIDALDDCTVSASFAPEDVTEENGMVSVHMTAYTYELFDMVDIGRMKVGDVLVINGEEMPVESVERNDLGLVTVNGGFEMGGCNLYTEDDTVYCEILMDIDKSYHPLGEITLPLAEDFVLADDSDIENQGKECTAEEFLAALDAGTLDFNQFNTTVTIQGGQIVKVHVIFLP